MNGFSAAEEMKSLIWAKLFTRVQTSLPPKRV